jgi:hypothetical protein
LRLIGNKVLRVIFGSKWAEVAGGWRRLHKEELHNLYTSPNIIRVIKSRRMGWTVYVARIGELKNIYRIVIGNLRGRGHSEELEVDGEIILEWILGK